MKIKLLHVNSCKINKMICSIKLVLKNWDMENQIKIPRSLGNPTHCHRQFTVAKNRNVSSSESVGPTSNRPYISLDCTAFFVATNSLSLSLSPLHTLHTVFPFPRSTRRSKQSFDDGYDGRYRGGDFVPKLRR